MESEDIPRSSPEWHPSSGADRSPFTGEIVRGISVSRRSPSKRRRKQPLEVDAAMAGIERGDSTILARAITLIESEAAAHKPLAREIVRRCLPLSGASIRIGITGAPGVGKSTFIECFGKRLCGIGHKVAVLAVDPSSSVGGGSILGDKTRMEELSRLPTAFIRPSPAGGTLGGVAAKTRESIILCEAAGYDVILVETVGVGQSEVAVRSMVDFFLLLQIAGAGDELQAIKKGVIEMADAIVVNKADGDNLARARLACAEYQRVLRFLHPYTPGWTLEALACSATTGDGVEAVWEMIRRFRVELGEKGLFEGRRAEQRVHWFRSLSEEGVLRAFYARDSIKALLPGLRARVAAGEISVVDAVDAVVGSV